MAKRTTLADAEMMLKIAQDGALSWMDQLIAGQEDGIKALKKQREQFVETCANEAKGVKSSMASPISVLSWFLNDVNNMRMQGRLDLSVNHASAIALATTNKQAASS